MKRGIMLFGAFAASGTLLAAELPLEEGFEDDLATLRGRGWTLHSTASLGREDGGSQCLRLEVPDGQKRYAEVFIPVEAGKFYRAEVRMRAAEVKSHPAAGSNRGAVIFLQWADHQKKHVSGGAFPRGLHGTHGWTTHRVSHTNRIPDNVGFLHVLLGVEGQGTAWFDDLRVSEIAPGWDGPALLQPTADTTVPSQRPDVAWEDMSGLSYRLEFSRDGQFSPETTIAGEVRGATGRPAGWLAPGEWHLRITPLLARDNALPEPQSHRFTVAADAVAWPPDIEPHWAWSDAPRPELAARFGPPGVKANLAITVGGIPARILSLADGSVRFQPTADLPAGVHEVRIEATLPGQKPVVSQGIFCNKQPGSRVTFHDGRTTLVDGKPFFPLGTYRDPSDRTDTFDGVLAAGFNLTHDYLFEHTPQTVETTRAYLDAAHAAGLKVFLGIARKKIHDRDHLWIQRWVAELMDHPAILTWYLMDEPDIRGLSADDLRRIHDLVHMVDPFHPTSVVYCKPGVFADWADCQDLHWNDPYPLPSRPLAMVEDWTRQGRAAVGETRPLWTVLQGHDYRFWRDPKAAWEAHGAPNQPSPEHTRCMTFLALAAGTNGLVWYWGPRSKYRMVEDAPKAWGGIVVMVQLLRRLEPWLTAPRTAADAIELPEPFRAWTRVHDGQRLLALVNSSPEPATLALDLTPWNATAATDHETGEAVPLQQGKTALEFAPHQVRLLRF
ncbi:MAG: hypothetical protein RBU25_11955 [Lentisphaeria bacterium]|jgi:hypothetical protein|nr:hypothetical protein [Lentisphaeria bacterium]